MKKIVIPAFFLLAFFSQNLQAQTADQLHETAKSFMKQGDYANAVLVLNRSLLQDPGNMEIKKDLAESYNFEGNYAMALQTMKPLLNDPKADDQCYLIIGGIYKQLGDADAEQTTYKKGLKQFPANGPLYNVLGEAQFAEKNYDAIKNWEKGIRADPSYSRNYFNAARYYFFTTDKVWSILYGEIFINMEPNSPKTQEMKQVVLESYKKLFSAADIEKENKDKGEFVKEYLAVMNKASSAISGGINTASLSSLRTRFIIDWFAVPTRPAFKLFEQQQQLLREGMFEAYDQWLFGAVENNAAYQNWVKTHSTENDSFFAFQKNRVFKVPEGQYYR